MVELDLKNTIAGIATSLSTGGISIIRVSGDNAIEVVSRIFVFKNPKRSFDTMKTFTMAYGNIVDDGIIVDEVIISLMRKPNSYTTEDVVEINCHGGIYVTKRIYDLVIKNGARPAEPGEFTKRAFLNGRIDLTQAESVMDLISSQSERSLKQANSGLRGIFKDKIVKLRKDIMHETAFIEAALDDPEHYSLEGFSEELSLKNEDFIGRIDELIGTYKIGKLTKEGIRTAIVGKPNVGKSSLMNCLLGEDRAIVTDIAGTTRDTLEEVVRIKDVHLRLIDTAGLRNSDDIIERIGVERSWKEIENAELILFVVDGSNEINQEEIEIFEKIKDKPFIIIKNKADLGSKLVDKDVFDLFGKMPVSISALEETGLDELASEINSMFFEGSIMTGEEAYVSNERQLFCLNEAKDSLLMVKEGINMCVSEDFLTIDLVSAYEILGRLIGEEMDEDLIDTIFKDFCMGK